MDQPNNHQKLEEKTANKFQKMKRRYTTFEKHPALFEELYEQGRFPIYRYVNVILLAITATPLVIYWIIYRDFQSFIDLIMMYQKASEKGDIAGILIILLLSSAILVFGGFRLWIFLRSSAVNKKLCDFVFLCLYVAFLILYVALPAFYIVYVNLPEFSTVFVLSVQVFQAAKFHSYVRENVPKVLNNDKLQKDLNEDELWRPSAISFISFMIAPSLIYNDTYPRTFPSIKRLCRYYIDTIVCMILIPMGVMFWYKLIYKRFGECSFFSIEHFLYFMFIFVSFNAVTIVVIGYGGFHCAFNFWSEVTMFGDRSFCKEWWKCTTILEFARTWSFPIHQYLHTYIYVDSYNVFLKDRYKAVVFTFFGSAMFHDYIFSITLKTFLPVMNCAGIFTLIFCPSIYIHKKGGPPRMSAVLGTLFSCCIFLCYMGYSAFARIAAMHR